jgi:choline kinase
MKAIIAAAGRGARLGALTRHRPKCLLPINGESILARQLRILKLYGVNDIAIITGYKAGKIIERFKGKATLFNNPDFSTTTSTASLQKATDFMDEDMITLCSDVIFSEEFLKELVNDKHEYCMLVDKKHCDQEAVKVQITGNKVMNASKFLPLKDSYGEWAYISKIRKSGLSAYKSALLECVNENLGSMYIFNKLIEKGYDVYYQPVNYEWTEVDFVRDLVVAKSKFEPS